MNEHIESLLSKKAASAEVMMALHDRITVLSGSVNLDAEDREAVTEILATSLALKNIIESNIYTGELA